MDPEVRLPDNSRLLLRLLRDDQELLQGDDWETIEKWEMDNLEIQVISSNRLEAVDKEIEVLVKEMDIGLHSLAKLQKQITERGAERNKLESTLLKAVAYKKINHVYHLRERKEDAVPFVSEQKQSEIRLKRKFLNEITVLREEKQELEVLVSEMKRAKSEMKLQHMIEKDESKDLADGSVYDGAFKLREMESKMERKLRAKEVSMDLSRKKNEADQLQLKEAHKLECDALRSEVQQLRAQAEGRRERKFPTKAIDRILNVPTLVDSKINRLRDNRPNVAPDFPEEVAG